MKFYDSQGAPNPRRVKVFLAEKGIEVPTVEVSLAKGENRTDEYVARNPFGQVPMLELDDGTCIAESVAICRYFEETHPDPPLFGTDAADRAVVEMWNRRAEHALFLNYAYLFQNTHDFFKGRMPQVPEYGEVAKNRLPKVWEILDRELAEREFLAGERYTIADITAQCGFDFFGRVLKVMPGDELKNLHRWYGAVSSRPSAKV